MPLAHLLAQQIHPGPRQDLLAEFAFLDPPKSDESFPADIFFCVQTGELGGRLDHQNPRKQRPSRDMAWDPEFIVLDVAKAQDLTELRGGPDDAVELLHLAALGVEFAH